MEMQISCFSPRCKEKDSSSQDGLGDLPLKSIRIAGTGENAQKGRADHQMQNLSTGGSGWHRVKITKKKMLNKSREIRMEV